MPANRIRSAGYRSVVSGALGLSLVGMAALPAQAESIREREWHLTAMRASQMWRTSTGIGVTVTVIDSGVNAGLTDLAGRVLPGRDEAPDAPGDERTDPNGHGTLMALLIAGSGRSDEGAGTFGLAPGVKILPVRTPDRGLDSGRYIKEFSATVSRGIRFAVDSGSRVINISMAVPAGTEELTAAVKYALDKGSLIFAGVGNSGSEDDGNPVEYPGATPGVVGVAAVGKNLHRTTESEHGPQVDIAAPGEEMYHACPNGSGLCRSHGTSDATALASASAALIWSKHPTWTNNQVLRVMLNTIGGRTDGAKRNDSIGYGIVRPRIALRDPGDPGPADEYPLPDLAPAAPATSAAASSGTHASSEDDESAAVGFPTDGGNSTPWIVLGAGAVVLIGVVAAVATRRRRI
ncbi:type VII secretion-associated serine protease mycosin [Streptomyces sp. me109]|uniref:type VII secretion-associated serine protease mycosin n=1 Tax=Streptomyces sp. me109 TaxID=1827853 RepID=UPI0011CE9AE2|nr:type VII secretion-associated serine protease mycosin [Streptomyces sp. me109]TXS72720.1 type VII secretion-associated serine protease mycosin [Streptomyces sp. me109]